MFDGGVQVDSTDLLQAVRESAMLADITISTWSAERSDRNLMEQVKAENDATGNVGRVVKNRLAGADSMLKEVKSAFNAMRSTHYSLTLPWQSDAHVLRATGPRLLPHKLFERYLTSMTGLKRSASAALDKFIAEYPTLVAQAKSNLGKMADVEYPTAAEVRSAFRARFDFSPIPSAAGAFRGLPEAAVSRLSLTLQKRQKAMVAESQRAMWAQARERIAHLVAKLSDQEAKFHASTVENARELIGLLPAWNVSGDARVTEIQRDIESMLTGVDAKDVRGDASAREALAAQAKSVVDKLDAWGL